MERSIHCIKKTQNYLIGGIIMLKIGEMNRSFNEEEETYYYYSEQMLNDKVVIKENTFMTIDDNVETIISVEHLNDLDAEDFTMYWDDLLSPIQSYRIIKDIYELYQEHSLSSFLEIIRELSVSYTSALMQSREENKQRIVDGIRETFNSFEVVQV